MTPVRPLAKVLFMDKSPIRMILILAALAGWLLWSPPTAAEPLDDVEAGYRAYREGDYAKAIELFTQVIRNKDTTARQRATAFLLRGEAHLDLDKLDLAEKDFRWALKIRNKYHQAYYHLGLVYERRGQLTEAFQSVRQAAALKPDDERYGRKMSVLEAKLKAAGLPVPPRPGR